MKKIALIFLASVVTVSMLTISSAPNPAWAQKKFVWQFENPWPKGDLSWDVTVAGWKEGIERVTNGRITLNVLPTPEAIVPGGAMLDAVSKGTLDAGVSAAVFTAGSIFASYLTNGFPGCWTTLEDSYTLIHKKGLIDIARKAYAEHNVYHLAIASAGAIYAQTNFPINTLNDLKGKKMAAPGVRAAWFKEFGVSVVNVPVPEFYLAMKLGTIDGLTFTGAELEGMKLKEVCKYVSLPPLYLVNSEFLLNLDRWKELPDDLKAILNKWSEDQYMKVGRPALDIEAGNLEKAKAYGVRFITLSKADQAKLRAAAEKSVWVPLAKKDKYFAQGVEVIKAFYKAR